jgi:hypothetical protein
MSSANLIRWGGLAAMIAGILRGVSSLAPNVAAGESIALLYLVTDIFLLIGMMGLYGFQHRESGAWGLGGCLLAIGGLAIIRTGAITGLNLYPIGAVIFAMGLSALAIGSWVAGKLPRWVSIVWVVSTVIGFVGYFAPGLNFLFVVSGVLFGVSFASAGLKVWTDGEVAS